jgi:hypothetical protein
MAKERAEEDLAGSPDAPRPNTGPTLETSLALDLALRVKKNEPRANKTTSPTRTSLSSISISTLCLGLCLQVSTLLI